MLMGASSAFAALRCGDDATGCGNGATTLAVAGRSSALNA